MSVNPPATRGLNKDYFEILKPRFGTTIFSNLERTSEGCDEAEEGVLLRLQVQQARLGGERLVLVFLISEVPLCFL